MIIPECVNFTGGSIKRWIVLLYHFSILSQALQLRTEHINNNSVRIFSQSMFFGDMVTSMYICYVWFCYIEHAMGYYDELVRGIKYNAAENIMSLDARCLLHIFVMTPVLISDKISSMTNLFV